MQELQFLKEMVKEKINRRLGEPRVKDIFFVLGGVRRGHLSGASDSGLVPHREEPEVCPGRRQEPFVELTVPPLENENLKEVFAALLAARRRRLKGEGAP